MKIIVSIVVACLAATSFGLLLHRSIMESEGLSKRQGMERGAEIAREYVRALHHAARTSTPFPSLKQYEPNPGYHRDGFWAELKRMREEGIWPPREDLEHDDGNGDGGR